MTDRTHPEAGSTHIIRYALELGLLWIDGDGRDKVREALTALDALEAKLASIRAGGVQALSAAPEAIAKLRHLYQNMVNGAVRDTASAKRIAEGLLAPAIEALERATPPAEQQAKDSYIKLLADCRDAFPVPEHGSPIENEWIAAVGSHEAVPAYLQAVAKQQAAQKAAAGEPTGKQSLQVQVWVLPNGKGGGQFSWEPQDERFWTKLVPQQAASTAAPVEPDPADIIAGALQISRGHAIEMMREALVAAPQQEAQEPVAVPRFNCWSTNEGDSWFDHPADSQAIYDCLGNDAKVGDEYELTAGWTSVTARYRITEVVGDGEEYEVECISHPHENSAPQPAPAPLSDDTKDAARYRWLRNKSTVLHGTAWLGSATAYQRDVDFLRRDDALAALDAAIDAAIAAQGEKDAG